MAISNVSEFKKEIEEIGLKNPKIKFDNHSIKIVTLPYFNDIFLLVFLGIGSSLFVFEFAVIFGSIICFCAFWYFLYFYFIGLGICQIDFSTKTLTYKNRIFLLNLLRRFFGFKRQINFSEIKKISCKEGLQLDISSSSYQSRYHLFIETQDNPGVSITQFKTEKEAQFFVAALQKFLLSKEKL
ncbi:hypothetical protein CAP36_04460 [Chitinophagaceae bacterium IBVUCB2]|nr:hypothetical protein CAP36_04460 [Chitinophagaceae bacterium IBVUCB2]